MPYLILILVPVALLGGFLVLTYAEGRRGFRVLSGARTALDTRAARVIFVVRHVDWSAVLRHIVQTSMEVIAHDVAHGTLIVVRWAERSLTRVVRALRARRMREVETPALAAPRHTFKNAVAHARAVLRSARTARTLPVSDEGE